jgi:DNA-binding transcriptional regulator YhcF (GntR family)
MEIVIPLSKNGEPFFRQIYKGMRQAILSGAFPAGVRLPSTRDLAEQLGVSRTVVLLAYEQLLAEGFAEGRGGSGTYVPQGLSRTVPVREMRSARLKLSRYGSAAADAMEAVDSPHRRGSPVRYDFAYGRSAIESFPLEMWRRIMLRHARQAPVREFEYGPAAGSFALREAICAHLRRSRAVVCDPSEVIVVNGSQQALDLVTRVLVERGDRVAIEDPQYNGTREVLRAAGAQLTVAPVSNRRHSSACSAPGIAEVGETQELNHCRERSRWRVSLRGPAARVNAGAGYGRSHRLSRHILAYCVSGSPHRIFDCAEVAGSCVHRGQVAQRSALRHSGAGDSCRVHQLWNV